MAIGDREEIVNPPIPQPESKHLKLARAIASMNSALSHANEVLSEIRGQPYEAKTKDGTTEVSSLLDVLSDGPDQLGEIEHSLHSVLNEIEELLF